MARPARFDPNAQTKGKGKGKGRSRSGSGTPRPASQPKGKGRSKGRSKGRGKGKKSDGDDTQSREDKTSKPDPPGPNMVPQSWKDKDYEDIPIVQEACPSDDHVAAYIQGTSEVPTFRVSWITSVGTTSRTVQVSPNKFGEAKLWKTPAQEPEFREPCKQDHGYRTLTPGDEDCCRMCPDTDAEELIPCAWCNSWAHYRCTYAVGPRKGLRITLQGPKSIG